MNKDIKTIMKKSLTGELPHCRLTAELGKYISETFENIGLGRNCLNCDNWNDPQKNQFPAFMKIDDARLRQKGCILANFQIPPLEIVVTGCEKHSDLIPF